MNTAGHPVSTSPMLAPADPAGSQISAAEVLVSTSGSESNPLENNEFSSLMNDQQAVLEAAAGTAPTEPQIAQTTPVVLLENLSKMISDGNALPPGAADSVTGSADMSLAGGEVDGILPQTPSAGLLPGSELESSSGSSVLPANTSAEQTDRQASLTPAVNIQTALAVTNEAAAAKPTTNIGHTPELRPHSGSMASEERTDAARPFLVLLAKGQQPPGPEIIGDQRLGLDSNDWQKTTLQAGADNPVGKSRLAAEKMVPAAQALLAADSSGAATSAASTAPGAAVSPSQNYQQLSTAGLEPPAVNIPVGKPGWSKGVMAKVMWMSSQRISSAEIALDPPELGPLQVRLSAQHDQASVVFSSQHAGVREALDQGLPRLRELFENQGLDLVDVNVADQQQSTKQFGDDSAESGAESSAQAKSGEVGDSHEQPAASLSTRVIGLVDDYV